jgi:alkanesulfonate monooxygenase SsuD/methylene tetrahydromethanopterin reductase-like flavin-dependent oxidoreductase (luciferase family)
VELGLGTGWYDDEHTAFGIDFPPLGERFERFEEQLQIVTGLWAAHEPFSFAGTHYSLTNAPPLTKPAQAQLPIIIGGGGAKRTPRLAATYADEFNLPFGSVEATAAQFDRVRSAAELTGRTLTMSAAQIVCCGRDEAEVARRAAAIGREPDELRSNGLAGSPAEVVDKIGRFAAVGATRIYLQVMDLSDLDHLELIAAEVVHQL